MKIRSGFVSNSSSSSFVMIVKKEAYENVFSNLSKLEQKLAEDLFKETNVFGELCMLIEEYSDMGGEGTIEWTIDNFDVCQVAEECCPEGVVPNSDTEEWSNHVDDMSDMLSDCAYGLSDKFAEQLKEDQYFSHSFDT